MQKPTVGRQVHYYGHNTFWNMNRESSPYPRAPAASFDGPFAATVVFVHPDSGDGVNLLICFPCACHGSAEKTQLVEYAGFSEQPKPGCWTWPPRV